MGSGWQDRRGGNFDIYARLVGADGQPQGSELLLENNTQNQFGPKVAFLPGQYLVAWRQHNGGDNYQVLGQRVSSGEALQGSRIDLSGYTYLNHGYFDLTSNGVNEYLAVWDRHYSQGEIRARRILSDGSLTGDEVVVTNTANDQIYPAVAYGAGSGIYLTAWEDHRLGRQLIYGQRLNSSGGLQGSNFSLSRQLLNRQNPDVVAWGSGEPGPAFLAVWEENRAGSDDLYGRWLTGAGEVSGSELALSVTPGDEDNPAVACGQAIGQCLVVWHSDAGGNGDDIYAQRVAGGGLLGGVIALMAAGGHQRYAHLSYNSQAGEWLVVWIDYANSQQITARRVFSDGPAGPANLIAPYANEVDLAYHPSANEYLVAWQRYYTNGEHPFIQRVGPGGQAVGPAQVMTTPGHQAYGLSAGYHPAGGYYLVSWADSYANTLIRAQRVLSSGALVGGVQTLYDYPGDVYQSSTARPGL
jgi:hypothetical protein